MIEYEDGNSVSFEMFSDLKDYCFPSERIDEISFINNIGKKNFIFSRVNEQICGYILFDRIGQYLNIIHLCVHPKFRRQNIGKSLLRYLEDFAISEEIDKLGLFVNTSNKPAIELYRKLNYKFTYITFQFTILCNNIVHHRSNLYIEPVTKRDLEFIMNYLNIRDESIQYKFLSARFEIFVILTKIGSIAGIFAFDKSSSSISSLFMSNPDSIIPLIYRIYQSIQDKNNDLIITTYDEGIAKYLDGQNYSVMDYKLLYLTKSISEK